MQQPSIPGSETGQGEVVNMGGAANPGLPRFFRAANYRFEGLRFRLAHKTPIPKKSKVELVKPKVEFIEQLLTENNPADAPILISYEKSHVIDVLTFEGERICELVGHEAKITAAKALSDNIVVTGDASGVLIVWDLTPVEGENSERKTSKKAELNRRHLSKRFQEHTDVITAIEAIDGQNFVSASLDGTFRYWRTDSDKALQMIESDSKRPILALTLLSEEVVLYCVERFESKYMISYDIVKCRRSDLVHTIIDQPNYSSGIFGPITHIKLTPDGSLALFYQMRNTGMITNHTKGISLYSKPPVSILSNGRVAFLGKKRVVVVEQYPLIEKPMLSVEANEIVREKVAPVSFF